MGSRNPGIERNVDSDGVTRVTRQRTSGGLWIVGLALGFTVLCLALSAWLVHSPGTEPGEELEPPRSPERAPPPRAATPPPQATARPVVRPAVQPVAPLAQAVPQEAPPQEAPAEVPDDSGPKEGLALFRPGTKPLKQGIIVPEDFELPPGYVRHYQTTDDGQMQKPILMFHPDYKPVDSNGQPVELPSNRVVPPEWAPPGMPIDILELPAGPEGMEPIP